MAAVILDREQRTYWPDLEPRSPVLGALLKPRTEWTAVLRQLEGMRQQHIRQMPVSGQ